jgi:hypothetical protein
MLPYFAFSATLITWVFAGITIYYLTNNNFAIGRNYNSAAHASLVILTYLLSIPGYGLYYVSMTYYIIDTVYELIYLIFLNKKTEMKLFDCGLLTHHLVVLLSLKYLYDPLTGHYVHYLFYLSELSNIPMYVIYHLRKIKYTNTYVIKSLVLLETLGYAILRLFLASKEIYNLLFIAEIPRTMIISAISIVMISAFWTWKLVRQLIKN